VAPRITGRHMDVSRQIQSRQLYVRGEEIPQTTVLEISCTRDSPINP